MDRIESEIADRSSPVHPVSGDVSREPYWLALDAALLILEELDSLPKSNMPVRLATVIGIVLDAIHGSEGGRQA